MRKFVTTIAPKATSDAFTVAVNAAIVPLVPFKISILDAEKAGMRSMSEGREGYSRLISRIATQFPNALSRADLPTELVALLEYYDRLEANRMALLQAMELIVETSLGTATDIMTLVDRYAQNLTISRGNDSAIDLAMREVDEWNSRFANKKNDDDDATDDKD